ncbi:hypothetical protein BD626DRAFT_390725 [Schizophyllum amplum]|uniref:NmrA-like domain-containing protein n=1 Tax=Schizophyllum amplum TaxID=97359 RepID=A0A550D0K7_9AGAR|nr:hypothetical protein BD626DRAFT_390725 [Auriculariopsis ampla]
MSEQKPLVVIFGASGETGRSIVEGLLRSGEFRVAAVARNPSKPNLVKFAERGVTVHQADLLAVTQERLREILTGADCAIATLPPTCIEAQKDIVEAAKAVGVRRFVPDDFGTEAPTGVMYLHDQACPQSSHKLAIREYIKKSGLGYTFIEVGYWMHFVVPWPVQLTGFAADLTREVVGTGDVPLALTNLSHIGDYVARVIKDDRTLNQTVLIWEDEKTQNQGWAHTERKLGSDFVQQKKKIPEAELMKQLEAARAAPPEQIVMRYIAEYRYSMYIRGDNTVAKAKAAGALDFKELYPDVKAPTFEEFMDAFYESPYVPYADAFET